MRSLLPALYTVSPFVVAVLMGVLFPLLAMQCYRHFAAGMVVVGLSILVDAYFLQSAGIELGLKLYVADFALVLIAGIAAARWLSAADQPRRHLAWVVFATVFFVGLAIGLGKAGTAAGVQARNDFYALAAATYAMSFPIAARHVRQLTDALVVIALLLLALCVYRWTVYYSPLPDLLPPEGTYNIDGAIRVIGSNSALIVAQALLLGIFFPSVGFGVWMSRLLAPFLLGGVVVLQHRSVWLAALVGVLVSLLMAGARQASRLKQMLLLGVIGLVTALALLLGDSGSNLSGQLTRSASTALAGQGTAHARFENWRATLGQWIGEGPRALAIGRGFGGDTTRYVYTESGERREISFGAHNHYVAVLSGMGIVGFGAWIAVIAFAVRGLYRFCAGGDGGVEAAALFMLMCTQLVYYVAYGSDYLQFLIFGVAVAYVSQRQREDRPAAGPLSPRPSLAPPFAEHRVHRRLSPGGPL